MFDLDADNDGILDAEEGALDSDNDGVADYLDLDSDNDGIADIVEAGGVDSDGDGTVDSFTDVDGNGIDDALEAEALAITDTDNDGVADYIDLDSDNDGITDIVESQGVNADLDGDAMVDEFVDNNGDGLDDALVVAPTVLTDTDGDGIIDSYDADANGDGIIDLFSDPSLLMGTSLPDDNGDLIPNYLEAAPTAAAPAIGDGVIRTGLAGSGCSISSEQSRKDPIWLVLCLIALASVRRFGRQKSKR